MGKISPHANRSKRARTSASSIWSTRSAIPRPPAAVTSSAVSSIVSGRPEADGFPGTLPPV